VRRVVFLVLFGVLLGALLTGIAGALPGSHDPDALTWLGTVATVAALVVAVGIYRVQQQQNDVAHQELLEALKAQDEILQDLADATSPSESPASAPAPAGVPAPADVPAPVRDADALTPAQREAVQAQYGDRSIDTVLKVGPGRGNGPRLVQLDDGTLLTVFTDGRGGRVRVHQVRPRRDGSRQPRDKRPRAPGSR
jgi:hypothetical protein